MTMWIVNSKADPTSSGSNLHKLMLQCGGLGLLYNRVSPWVSHEDPGDSETVW